MKQPIYINGLGVISPQKTFDVEGFLTEPIEYHENYILALDAAYKEYINPVQIRRMSRILKMTLSAAKKAMQDAGIEKPDAIIAGSGYGCIDDTEKFLLNMLDNKETMLNPTAFMQSTHNSVAGMVALNVKCNAYNFTYVHRGFSFETSLLDAMMWMQEGKENVLIGGFDENSVNHHTVTNKIDFWKKEKVDAFDLLKTKTIGSISGEGANFMLLSSNKNEHTYGEVKDVRMCYKPNEEELLEALSKFLKKNNLEIKDIDIDLTGLNGDVTQDRIYYRSINELMKDTPVAWFKHLCGDYYTAGSFGLWVAAQICKRQEAPAILMLDGASPKKPIKNILLYNHYRNINHSFYLIQS